MNRKALPKNSAKRNWHKNVRTKYGESFRYIRLSNVTKKDSSPLYTTLIKESCYIVKIGRNSRSILFVTKTEVHNSTFYNCIWKRLDLSYIMVYKRRILVIVIVVQDEK